MTRINIIDNIVIKEGHLRVIDRFGDEKRVFLRQGYLEGECAVYSLLMMLMIHQRIDDDDLILKNSKVSADVKQLRKIFLYKRKARGYDFEELQKNSSKSLMIISPSTYILPIPLKMNI